MTADMLELIQRDLDGDLSPEEKLVLEKHLQADPELQLVYSRLQRVSAQLEQLPNVTPPFSIVDSILPKLEIPDPVPVLAAKQGELPRLERRAAAAQEQPRTKTRRFPLWAAKAGSGVAAACLLFGLFMLTKGGEPAGVVDQTSGSQPKSVTVQQSVDDPASPGDNAPDKAEPPQKEPGDSASQGTPKQNQPAGSGENSASSQSNAPNAPAKSNHGSPGQGQNKGVPAVTDKEKEKAEKEREKAEKEKEKEKEKEAKEKEKAEKKENNNDNSALIDKKLHEMEEWQKKQEEKKREEEEKQRDRGK
ncbi:anti-sigma factor family protein [Brevibacillus sp. B_LB10_24]|uniref:anti-sigma factor n=1 Tax=Brevibacillus sp. B_LB10_24 TaxID=3380645 RepID=UPI0038B74714